MFCENCGSPLNDNEKFCRNCGAPVPAAAPKAEPVNGAGNVSGSYTEPQQSSQPGPAPVQQNYQNYQSYQDFNAQPAVDPDTPGAKARVSFMEAVALYFKNYVNFKGRSVLTEYWFVFLFNIIIAAILGVLTAISEKLNFLEGLWTIAILIPTIALEIRRLHDIGKSGWYLFMNLIPIAGPIIFIIYMATASAGDNEYGPRPMD